MRGHNEGSNQTRGLLMGAPPDLSSPGNARDHATAGSPARKKRSRAVCRCCLLFWPALLCLQALMRKLEPIQRALQIPDIPGHDMGIDLGGLDIRMAEEFL